MITIEFLQGKIIASIVGNFKYTDVTDLISVYTGRNIRQNVYIGAYTRFLCYLID